MKNDKSAIDSQKHDQIERKWYKKAIALVIKRLESHNKKTVKEKVFGRNRMKINQFETEVKRKSKQK